MPQNNIILKKLHECYATLQVVDYETQLINKSKFEAVNQQFMTKGYIKEILQKRIQVITQVVEPSITEILLLLAQVNSKFHEITRPLTLDRESESSIGQTKSEETQKSKCNRIDHFFEIGLLLTTVVSASIFQYVSAKYQFQTDIENSVKLLDLRFLFKELTIPIVALISAWLLKELLPEKRFGVLRHLKRFIREFCWTLLSNFLILELLSLIFLGFITDLRQLSTSVGIMTILFALSTFPITLEYKKCELNKELELNKRFLRFMGVALIEHGVIYYISIIVILLNILLSVLPGP